MKKPKKLIHLSTILIIDEFLKTAFNLIPLEAEIHYYAVLNFRLSENHL